MGQETKVIKYLLGSLSEISVHIGKCWITTTGGTVWTDETTDMNSATASDVPSGPDVNDATYFGSLNPFGGITAAAGTSSAGGSAVWEYWNGSTWTTLTQSGYVSTAISATSNYSWVPPTDWATTQVNSEVDGPWYYVRLRVTTTRTTAGTWSQASIAPIHTVGNAFTVTIPETVNRTIMSCIVRVFFEKTGANGTILNYMRVAGAWDGGGLTALKTQWATDNTWTLWSEKSQFIDDIDITSSAQTAWASGTAHTYTMTVCGMGRATGVGSSTNSYHKAWAEMYITYESDDASTTKANTITIAIPSIVGTLATTQTTLGNLPAISGAGGILEESGVTIRDLYITYHANWDEAGTTDWQFFGQINSETEVQLADNDAAQQSDWYMPIPWRKMDLNFSTSNQIKARVTSNSGATASHVGALVTITYTYDYTNSTRRTHTEEIPYTIWNGSGAGTPSTDRAVTKIDWWVPGTNPTFKNFGAWSIWSQTSDPGNVRVTVGNNTERVYTAPHADTAGSITSISEATSAHFSFGRGYNTIDIAAYVDTTPTNTGSMTGVAYVTWSYDRVSGMDHYKGYSVLIGQSDYSSVSSLSNTTEQMYIPNISASNYFITNCGCDVNCTNSSSSSTVYVSAVLPSSQGRIEVPSKLLTTDANTGSRSFINEISSSYIKKYYNQPTLSGFRLDPTIPFKLVVNNSVASRISGTLKYNWHTFSYTVSGTISGSSGGTVTLRLQDFTTGELLQQTTRSGNGPYSFTHYDNTRDVIVVATESDTLKGTSKQDIAGSGFDINLAGTGSTGTKSFVWGN